MKLMGIDHGLARIGVAVSDATGLIARELTIIHRKSNADDFARLNALAAEHGAEAFVVGLPPDDELPPEVQANSQAVKIRNWVERFAETTTLPFVFWDEQMTSVDARELAKARKRKVRDPIDDLAARVILQSYLDAVRAGLADPPPTP